MSHTAVLLLDRALRYRQQATKARRLAHGISSEDVARNLVGLAHALERKAMRAERAAAVVQVREQQNDGERQLAAD